MRQRNSQATASITMTDFADFLTKSGTPRQTKVKQLKNRSEYRPEMDYWKSLREAIQEAYREGSDVKQALVEEVASQAGTPKHDNYERAASGYRSFLGRKDIEWFEPPTASWEYAGVQVSVRPELGLVINGAAHIVKAHFSKVPIGASQAPLLWQIMEDALSARNDADAQLALLNVQAGKLQVRPAESADLSALLRAEARCFVDIWRAV